MGDAEDSEELLHCLLIKKKKKRIASLLAAKFPRLSKTEFGMMHLHVQRSCMEEE